MNSNSLVIPTSLTLASLVLGKQSLGLGGGQTSLANILGNVASVRGLQQVSSLPYRANSPPSSSGRSLAHVHTHAFSCQPMCYAYVPCTCAMPMCHAHVAFDFSLPLDYGLINGKALGFPLSIN